MVCSGDEAEDLYVWWFITRGTCVDSRIKIEVIPRTFAEVAADPRYKPANK